MLRASCCAPTATSPGSGTISRTWTTTSRAGSTSRPTPRRSASAGVLHGGRGRVGALLRRHRVHPHDLPAVAVEVEEAARVHEAVVLGVIRLGATRCERGGGERVDLIAGRDAEAVQRQRV